MDPEPHYLIIRHNDHTRSIVEVETKSKIETTVHEVYRGPVRSEQQPTPWDEAHDYIRTHQVAFAEPDVENSVKDHFPGLPDGMETSHLEAVRSGKSPEDYCKAENKYDSHWKYPSENDKPLLKIWHLDKQFSQLQMARERVTAILKDQKTEGKAVKKIRIAHIDTGYDPRHCTFPAHLICTDLERNFTGEGKEDQAIDDGIGMNAGHGTGTLSILAGKPFPNNYGFNLSIGLTEEHEIEIVPIRIARSVVLFRSLAFEKALEYIIGLYDDETTRCHIVTMSMGGAPTSRWADLVNQAYEKGIFMVTAAGNNFGAATPRTLVYPARFNRVVAACGVTHDYTPYFNRDNFLRLKIMQGNYGPRKFMNTAIAAFTPNVPWAKFGCHDQVSLSGAGTSSATPQIAAAAALYYQMYRDEIDNLPEGWQKVQVIRKALFDSAKKEAESGEANLYLGNGILQASRMLDCKPDTVEIKKEKEDKIFLPVLQLLGEIVIAETFRGETNEVHRQMYELELIQLIQSSSSLQELLDYEEKEELSAEEKNRFIQLILSMPEASESLKAYLRTNTGRQ